MPTNVDQLPPHRDDGYLPDFVGDDAASNRSPFTITSAELVRVYGHTERRLDLIEGLLRFRSYLRSIPILGVQWLNGSFISDVEAREDRPPGDIDVVTWILAAAPPDLIKPVLPSLRNPLVRQQYGLDHYYSSAHQRDPQLTIDKLSYWHGMWSRSKSADAPAMKGFVALTLDGSDADDLVAQSAVDAARSTR